MFDGDWYDGGGPGGPAAATARGNSRGENPISRPSSASSLPDGRRYVISRPASEGGKRPFSSFEYEYMGFPESEGIILNPRPKRPRYIDFALERAREPAFFILKEAGQPPRPASAHSCHDDAAAPDAVLMRMPSPTTSERMLDHISSGGGSSSNSNEVLAHRFLRTDLTPPAAMERTSSGLSLAPEEDDGSGTPSNYSDMRKDEQAAARVERHFAQYHKRDSKAERILKSLISPRSSPGREEFEIDNAALQSIFRAANEIFFHGCLKNRVRWDWSDDDRHYPSPGGLSSSSSSSSSSPSAFSSGGSGGTGGGGSGAYYNKKEIIGTTALRTAADGGYETLIVLSRHYLRDRRYNRRLLISTFLHELIHSYLFVRCGFKARRFGGHTSGFRRIAAVIDKWAGPDTLFLSNMEADLDDFRAAAGNGGGGGTTTTVAAFPTGGSGSSRGLAAGGVGRRDSSTMTTMMMVEDDGIHNCCMRLPLSPAAVPPSSPPPLMVYRPPPPQHQHQQQQQQPPPPQQPDLRFMDQRNYGFEHRGGGLGFGPM